MARFIWSLCFVCVTICIATSAFCMNDKQRSMLRDLDTIQGIFEDCYAPAEWKKKNIGWDLKGEVEKAQARILENESLTIKEYQQILAELFNSPKDHHVKIIFYSTEMATLPFSVKSAEGRYFFTDVDRSLLSPRVFPINEGDELVLFEGRPVAEVVEELKKYERGCNPATEEAFAQMCLTTRQGALGHTVPKGPVEIQVRHYGSNKPSNYQLIWDYTSEKITSRFGKNQTIENLQPAVTSLLEHPFFTKEMVFPTYNIWKTNSPVNASKHFWGAKRSFVPRLGEVWWSAPSESQFHAYLFTTDDHQRVGYVRIPSYLPYKETAVEDFAEIIDFFEMRADALVIDQVDNPGGSVFYLYALASMLTDQPLLTPKYRVKISQAELFFVNFFISILENIDSDEEAQMFLGTTHEGNEVTLQMVKFFLNYLYFMVDEWNDGRQFTSPFYLQGIDQIHPHPTTQFTKPILFLTNAMDLSGGDFMPAILQDNKRVVIFGERTGGAGGYISRASFPNLNGIAGIQMTASIAERVDLVPLEGLGVTPDISYSLTVDDLQYGYQDYKEAVLKALKDLMNP